MNIKIANKLQKLRKDKGLTQEQLASELGVTRQAVSKWERAESSPDTDNLIRLSKLYEVSLDELLSTEDSDTTCISIKLFDFSTISGLLALIISAIYLILGFVFGIWHPSWIMFLLIPLTSSVFTAIKNRNIEEFEFAILPIMIYLLIGTMYRIWHPGWIVLLSIPIYETIISLFKKAL